MVICMTDNSMSGREHTNTYSGPNYCIQPILGDLSRLGDDVSLTPAAIGPGMRRLCLLSMCRSVKV